MSKLISLLKTLSQYHSKNDNTEIDEDENSDHVDDKVTKRCLKEVMEMIKVLLVASFCSKSSNQDIALSLRRKVSSCSGKAGEEDIAMDSSQEKS